MTRIMLDGFRRQWLTWSLLCLLFLAAGLILGIERVITISGVVFISFCIAATDWGFGCVRILRSLPLTARQIGLAYWWLIVGASTFLFAVFSAIGILIVRLAQTHDKFLGTWLQMFIATDPHEKFLGLWLEAVLAGGLLCGSLFWLMTGAVWGAALSRTGEPWRKRFWRQFYAFAFAIALVAGIYFLCKSAISATDKAVIAYCFGFIFSVLGWFRAKILFIDQNSFRGDVAGTGIPGKKFEPRPGYGGVPYLIIRFCLFYLAVVTLMIATIACVSGFVAWKDHKDKWSDIVAPGLVEFQFWLFFLCFVQTMTMATHLKFLRSLPLTSRQLAATILCLAVLPVLIIGGPWILLFLIEPGVVPAVSALSLAKFCLLNLAPVCVLTTGVIWYNEKHFKRIAGIILAWNISIVPIIFQLATSSRGGLPAWMIIAIPVLSIFIALLAVRRLLERNEMAYRIKFEMLPGWF